MANSSNAHWFHHGAAGSLNTPLEEISDRMDKSAPRKSGSAGLPVYKPFIPPAFKALAAAYEH